VQSRSHTSRLDLPAPGDAARAHSARLQDHILGEMRRSGGHISFARFMQLALHAPGLGYYNAGAHKLGEAGDFVTAPEISSLFPRCLARQCAGVMADMAQALILELGAGSGRMALELLRELERLGCLPAGYLILETRADLRQRQPQLLREGAPALAARVDWLDSLPAEPLEGLVLANEVLDAMPVERFCLLRDGVQALHVAPGADGFVWHPVPAAKELESRVEDILRQSRAGLPEGYTSELNMALPAWIGALSHCLARGMILLTDYGYPRHEYYHPDRGQGTLLCHYRHRAHPDPLVHVGLQDITASVDYSAVAEAAVEADLQVAGFTSQAFFLFGCGLEKLVQEAQDGTDRQRLETAGQVKLLTLPGEMGERFKAMALTRGISTALAGFSIVDQRYRL